MNYESIILRKNNEKDVEFTGVIVARNSNILVYETPKGHWVCSVFDIHGKSVRHEIIENKNAEKLHELLGDSDTAKSIYSDLGLNFNDKLDL
ncbi:hypothetical protein [Pectobacterium aroidearum]|uniref:hypothetical protein n=1 Tax=Pectobacterium aroidearum TaxID=1201031 RepID=UPI0032EE4D20